MFCTALEGQGPGVTVQLTLNAVVARGARCRCKAPPSAGGGPGGAPRPRPALLRDGGRKREQARGLVPLPRPPRVPASPRWRPRGPAPLCSAHTKIPRESAGAEAGAASQGASPRTRSRVWRSLRRSSSPGAGRPPRVEVPAASGTHPRRSFPERGGAASLQRLTFLPQKQKFQNQRRSARCWSTWRGRVPAVRSGRPSRGAPQLAPLASVPPMSAARTSPLVSLPHFKFRFPRRSHIPPSANDFTRPPSLPRRCVLWHRSQARGHETAAFPVHVGGLVLRPAGRRRGWQRGQVVREGQCSRGSTGAANVFVQLPRSSPSSTGRGASTAAVPGRLTRALPSASVLGAAPSKSGKSLGNLPLQGGPRALTLFPESPPRGPIGDTRCPHGRACWALFCALRRQPHSSLTAQAAPSPFCRCVGWHPRALQRVAGKVAPRCLPFVRVSGVRCSLLSVLRAPLCRGASWAQSGSLSWGLHSQSRCP